MPTDRDIALVRAGLEAALYANEEEGLDPAAIAETVPEPRISEEDWHFVAQAQQELLEKMRQRIVELEQELADLRRDAERYRWARDNLPGIAYQGDELDSAIDAAMATSTSADD